MKNHLDISGSIEIREVDIAGVACIYDFMGKNWRKSSLHYHQKYPSSLWHISLIMISIFCDFWKQTMWMLQLPPDLVLETWGWLILSIIFGLFVCLCWGLMSQSTIFQSCRDGATASWVINQYFRGVKCLAQGHNTVAVGFEPLTFRSGVRHATTETPCSHHFWCFRG